MSFLQKYAHAAAPEQVPGPVPIALGSGQDCGQVSTQPCPLLQTVVDKFNEKFGFASDDVQDWSIVSTYVSEYISENSLGEQSPHEDCVTHDEGRQPISNDCTTTMAILNIPYTYPAWKLHQDIDEVGLPYSYFHCPRDNRKNRNRGFAFIKFPTPEAADTFRRCFHNRVLSCPGSQEQTIAVQPSALQCFEPNVKFHHLGRAMPSKFDAGAVHRQPRSVAVLPGLHPVQEMCIAYRTSNNSVRAAQTQAMVIGSPSPFADGVVLSRFVV